MGKILKVVAALIHGASPGGAWNRSSSTTSHNRADTRFVEAMIIHHLQALRMADEALQRTDDEQVRALARTIKFTRPGEIERLRAWLSSWGETPSGARNAVGDAAGSVHAVGTSAMISEAALDEVTASEHDSFDRLWLQMMIEHHERAVDASKTEQADGCSPDAMRLARQVELAQRRLVGHMEACLRF